MCIDKFPYDLYTLVYFGNEVGIFLLCEHFDSCNGNCESPCLINLPLFPSSLLCRALSSLLYHCCYLDMVLNPFLGDIQIRVLELELRNNIFCRTRRDTLYIYWNFDVTKNISCLLFLFYTQYLSGRILPCILWLLGVLIFLRIALCPFLSTGPRPSNYQLSWHMDTSFTQPRCTLSRLLQSHSAPLTTCSSDLQTNADGLSLSLSQRFVCFFLSLCGVVCFGLNGIDFYGNSIESGYKEISKFGDLWVMISSLIYVHSV